MTRETFNIAEGRLKRRIGVIKYPLRSTTQKYITFSLAATPEKEEMIDINKLASSLIKGAQRTLEVADTCDYMAFAGDLFKTIELGVNTIGSSKNRSGISETDLFLLGFQLVNSQLDVLQAEANLLLDRTNMLESGLLDGNKKYLSEEILPYDSSNLCKI